MEKQEDILDILIDLIQSAKEDFNKIESYIENEDFINMMNDYDNMNPYQKFFIDNFLAGYDESINYYDEEDCEESP